MLNVSNIFIKKHYRNRTSYFLILVLIALQNQLGNTIPSSLVATDENISPLSRLPREILNHLASFLIFENYETDQELHDRLKKHAYYLPSTTPSGIIDYENGGIYLTKSSGKRLCLQKFYRGAFALSQNHNHYAYYNPDAHQKYNNKVHAINLSTNKTISFTERHADFLKGPIAISNKGHSVGYIFNNKVAVFDAQSYSITHIQFFTEPVILKSLEFNKQSTKLGVLFNDDTCSFISRMKEYDLFTVNNKSLEEYFKIKGICRNLIKQLANQCIFRVFDLE